VASTLKALIRRLFKNSVKQPFFPIFDVKLGPSEIHAQETNLQKKKLHEKSAIKNISAISMFLGE